MAARIAALYIHPVKSAAGIACSSALLSPAGFEHDREWMVVDPHGRFLTQRELPQLGLLHTALAADHLQLTRPDGARLEVPFGHEGERVAVQVWRSACLGFDAGAAAAGFLTEFLGRPVRLVRFDASQPRLADPEWTAGHEVPTRFPDGYPLLVLSRESIDDLAARVGRPLEVERFRPNVLIAGVPAYGEDAIEELSAGAVRLALTKACTRCVITTLDPATATRADNEPLATLRGYRLDPALRGVVFGRNAYLLAGAGERLAVGQAFESVVHG